MGYFSILETWENIHTNSNIVPVSSTAKVFLEKILFIFLLLVGKTEIFVPACLDWKWPSSHIKSCEAIRSNKYYERIIHAYVHAPNWYVVAVCLSVPWVLIVSW